MKIKISTLFLLLTFSLAFLASAQSKGDVAEIMKVIQRFTSGIDKQKGEMISNAFREGAGFYATNNRDKVLSVTPAQLAELHETKKFGGRDRKLTIKNVNITDDIVASVKVIAQDDVVYYTYYMALSKIDGEWLIQSVLQHSKKKS